MLKSLHMGGKAGEASAHPLLLMKFKHYSVLGLGALPPFAPAEVSWHSAVSQPDIQAGYLQNLQNGNWIFAGYLLHITRSCGVWGKEQSYSQDQH